MPNSGDLNAWVSKTLLKGWRFGCITLKTAYSPKEIVFKKGGKHWFMFKIKIAEIVFITILLCAIVVGTLADGFWLFGLVVIVLGICQVAVCKTKSKRFAQIADIVAQEISSAAVFHNNQR